MERFAPGLNTLIALDREVERRAASLPNLRKKSIVSS
jgi:hypothetical protein